MKTKKPSTIRLFREKSTLIALISKAPGIEAKDVPKYVRRHLRTLELAGRIEYRKGGWYLSGN